MTEICAAFFLEILVKTRVKFYEVPNERNLVSYLDQ